MSASGLFFALFAANAVPGRFFSIFYEAHALSPTQIGFVMSLKSLVSMPANAIICNYADRTSSRELVLIATQILTILTFLLQGLCVPSINIISSHLRFPLISIAAVLNGIFSDPSYALVSAISISHLRALHAEAGPAHFGTVRLWGAVSWALVAIPEGALMDYSNLGVLVQYGGFTLFSLIFIAAVARFRVVNAVPPPTLQLTKASNETRIHPETDHDVEAEYQEPSETSVPTTANEVSARTLLYNIVFGDGLKSILFFNLLFSLAIGMSVVENLLFLFFKNDLHASNLLCGLTVVVTVMFEIPMFAKAPRLLEHLGASRLAILGAIAYVVRVVGYTVAPNAWLVLLVEPMHGVTYAAIQTASVAFVAERTPPVMEATGQSFLNVLRCVGFTCGTAIGGRLFDVYGAKFMYRSAGLFVASSTIAFALVAAISNPSANSPSQDRKRKSGIKSMYTECCGEEMKSLQADVE